MLPVNEVPKNFTEVRIPVPPATILERALGYKGQARWIATWWEPGCDESLISDGQVSRTGNWEGYLLFTRFCCQQLRSFNLGCSDQVAQDWLVIDREQRRAYVAPSFDAARFLGTQWPRVEVIHLSEEKWNEIVDRVRQKLAEMQPFTEAQIQDALDEKWTAEAALRAWFNRN